MELCFVLAVWNYWYFTDLSVLSGGKMTRMQAIGFIVMGVILFVAGFLKQWQTNKEKRKKRKGKEWIYNAHR